MSYQDEIDAVFRADADESPLGLSGLGRDNPEGMSKEDAYRILSGYTVPEEFNDYLQIMEMGASKYGADNWLEPNGAKSSFKQMHASMFRHLAESSADGPEPYRLSDVDHHRQDKESGLDPLLHLICRAQMMYTRLKRNIRHEEDL